jgi:two-component system, NarL family, response regulator NreC
MSKLRIFLAEDHSVVREGLKALIERQADMEVVGEAGDGATALRKARECAPDVVIMDLSMPHLNGAQATEQLKRERPRLKVLALTAYEDGSYMRRLLAAGASGYLLKRVAANELIHALRTVAEGGTYIDPSMASKVVDSFVREQHPTDDAGGGGLSEREGAVLRMIAWGYSNKEIAAHLGISVKTVETHKTRLMEKLNLHSRVAIVRYAVEQGLLHDPSEIKQHALS